MPITSSDKIDLNLAYQKAIDFAKSHYENFPVISFLIPHDLQKHIAIIYWFARTADDLADEGNYSETERLEKLDHFQTRLTELLKGNAHNNFEFALLKTIETKNLSPNLFHDLLFAFKKDVTKKRYKNFDDILFYCKHSANPVGRLILELFNIRDEKAFCYSDKICTALQLTNFYQDVLPDYEKGRIYFPLDEMAEFGVNQNIFELNENNSNLAKLVELNINRTEQMFVEGKNLLNYLSGKLKYEIKWTILGGQRVLGKIKNNNYNIFAERPKLNKLDFTILLLKSFL